MHLNFGTSKENIMPSTDRPPIPMTPNMAAVMALATPLIQQFAAEIARLSPEEQNRRIAKVLAAMRDEGSTH